MVCRADLRPYNLLVPTFSKSGSLNLLEPSGSVLGLYSDCFTFYLVYTSFRTKLHTCTFRRFRQQKLDPIILRNVIPIVRVELIYVEISQ